VFPGVVDCFFVIMLARATRFICSELGLAPALAERWTLAIPISGLFIGYLYFSIPRVVLDCHGGGPAKS